MPVRVALLLGCLFPALVQAQDLVALAQKEKERRAKLGKPAKVLTLEDTKEAGAKGTGSVTTLPGPGSSPPPSSGPAAADSREASRALWKGLGEKARAAVSAAEATLAKMERDFLTYQSDLTQVSAAEAQDPLRLQKRAARIAEMNTEVLGQKAAVAEAKRALTALEDEARRNGVPPGWIR